MNDDSQRLSAHMRYIFDSGEDAESIVMMIDSWASEVAQLENEIERLRRLLDIARNSED